MIYSSFSLLLAHLWVGFISCAVYHIIPSPDHHCPVESCHTLSSIAANASQYLNSNTSLIFQPGNHTVYSELNITNVAEFSMTSYSAKQPSVGITCGSSLLSIFIFEAVDLVYISKLKLFGCKNTIIEIEPIESTLIIVTSIVSNLILVECIFENNEGVIAISAMYSNITVAQSIFRDNSVVFIFSYYYCNSMFTNSTFIDNEGELITYVSNRFRELDVVVAVPGDMLSTLIVTGCELRSNYNGLQTLISVHNSDVSIIDTKFFNNIAETSLKAFNSVISIDNAMLKHNLGSTIYLIWCTVEIVNSVYDSNEASPYGGALIFSTVIHIHGSEFKNIAGSTMGGAISCYDSLITLSKTSAFANNHAIRQGGAIYLDQSACFIAHGATVIITNNTASYDGGGIYLNDHSNLTLYSQSMLQILDNRATEHGGGIYASQSSSINAAAKLLNMNGHISDSTIYIHKNKASGGGGLYLDLNSTVYTNMCLNNTISFHENSAEYGGGVYVSTIPDPKCFFQSLPHPASTHNITDDTGICSKENDYAIQFSLNSANYSGDSLFKSVFDKCSINGRMFEELAVVCNLSNIQISDVGSFLVQVCYCKNDIPDCAKQIPFVDIKTGENLILDVAIVDKGNNAVYGSIKSEIRGHVLIRDDQKLQEAINGCTALIFNIYSFEYSQQLIMSPLFEEDSFYISTESSKRSIQLNFPACIDCPIGFHKTNDDARGCDCVCDVMKLGSYITNCNYTTESITKKDTTAWITYLSVKNTSDYLIHPYCPLDYCLPPDVIIEINLNIPNGADAQCAHNRSGTLCGACSPGLSLSLGSSRCLLCQTHWPIVFVAITIGSIFAGIILVASLLMLNLTVAIGTLNGLIFYANIVAANRYKFFPCTSFISVFVSWFNFELGIDTCFFDRMDFYWKTWVEIAFPVYILLLVVLMIIVSEHSVKFAEMVARRNPLATLNTLILLSYVKFLRTIILAFSFATLDYPDGSHPVVWWPDATVGYFSGKHIVLWAVAAIILVAGIFYTAILFSWQWLLYYQHKRIFKWILRNQRLCMFVEPNHAPYAFKHQYWAGLLLFVRVTVYIISTADVSSDRTITLLAIGIIISFLTILVCSLRPYKSWLVQILEVICYANTLCFCLATFYVSNVEKSQDVIAYISGTISLLLFLIVLSYHVITQLFFATRLGKKLKNKIAQRLNLGSVKTEEQINLVVQDNDEDEPVTYSEVDPPIGREELPQSHSDVPRSRRNKSITNNVSESADSKENELKPMEQEVINNSTPYILMK